MIRTSAQIAKKYNIAKPFKAPCPATRNFSSYNKWVAVINGHTVEALSIETLDKRLGQIATGTPVSQLAWYCHGIQ